MHVELSIANEKYLKKNIILIIIIILDFNSVL